MDSGDGYGFGVSLDTSMEEAEDRLRAALAGEGFGILTEIDVAETLRAKLGVDWVPYRILGACNPQLAHRALQADEHIGLLLPCNVILYRRDGETVVEVLEPTVMAELSHDPRIGPIADEARERLERALAVLSQT